MPDEGQRACIRLAAELAGRYPDWAVEWGLAGYSAHDEHTELGPVTTQPALEALLRVETARLAS